MPQDGEERKGQHKPMVEGTTVPSMTVVVNESLRFYNFSFKGNPFIDTFFLGSLPSL